jgi:hypothetical protein
MIVMSGNVRREGGNVRREGGNELCNSLVLVGPIVVTEICVVNPTRRFTRFLNERHSVRWLRIRLRLARELVGQF